MIVAIHQPNFFPWLGYFAKIATCDKFVILDNVQLPKTGGTWSNRVKIMIGGEAKWLTAPIVRNYHGVRNINEVEFDCRIKWRDKILKTLDANYRKCPFFVETMDMVGSLIEYPDNNMASYNIHLILSIAQAIGVEREKFVLSSSFPSDLSSNDLLVHLTRACGGIIYMCGGGADSYQDEDVFKKSGITLRPQNFTHPVYPQRGVDDFIPGMSIIDALMNVGFGGVRGLLSA